MIMTVTLNPALDVTYTVDALVPGQEHRVDRVHARAGGKGINVARILTDLGRPVRATGLIGGSTGERIAAELSRSTVDSQFVTVDGESRRTVVVVDGQGATGLWEPGPTVSAAEWTAFRRRFDQLLAGVSVVVLAGSLPPGVPDDAYAELTEVAHGAGARVVLDADGRALAGGLRAGPDVVKPNRTELAAVTGQPVASAAEALTAARHLRRGGSTAVVATLGADGMVVSTVEGDWRASAGAAVPGNPTGAGDACVAALAHGLQHNQAWPDRLADAVAVSAAAARAPVAGTVDLAEIRRWRGAVVVAAL
jgi:tagatose 6-phosphate kinase